MKFIIKSLLLVTLLLQMTSSLRKCFNQDQNMMLTIILLAFSLIGIIGLVISNRFILIVFAACMTLILIASITIYAIGRTEEDSQKPRVPYYTTIGSATDSPQLAIQSIGDSSQTSSSIITSSQRLRPNQNFLLVNKSLTSRPGRKKGTGDPSDHHSRVFSGRHRPITSGASERPRSPVLDGAAGSQLAGSTIIVAGSSLEQDLNDDPTSIQVTSIPIVGQIANRSLNRWNGKRLDVDVTNDATTLMDQQQAIKNSRLYNKIPPNMKQPTGSSSSMTANILAMNPTASISASAPGDQDSTVSAADEAQDSPYKVTNEQWVAYEHQLYERYLAILSQSIDLVMQTILASWMALLLDEDSDQCFGTTKVGASSGRDSSSARQSSSHPRRSNPKRQQSSSSHHQNRSSNLAKNSQAIYNYNGVRYSIRPDTASEPPTRLVVR